MPEHIQYEDDDLFNPETHREESDVPVKPLWWALILFVVFAVITHVVLYFMYQAMVKAETKRWEPPQTAVARPANAGVPQNQPLLQPFPVVPATETTATAVEPYQNTPVTDLQAMRANEDRMLKHYSWVDKQNGVVRIPIEEAKELMAARIAVEGQRNAGVPPADQAASSPPVSAPATAPATTPTTAATTTGGAH
ncbi:MAG TPA: hypothetical protein VFV49_07125 [Thermoanaerobaculia bacterium]|nr:hypothetical protein [Thermoanaerobaculia bacterium]